MTKLTQWQTALLTYLKTILLALCAVASVYPTLSQALTFTDNFNRPDSPTVGNGWSDTAGNVSNNLEIKNNELTCPPTGGSAGIFRPFPFTAPITTTATVKEQSGFGTLLRRYVASFRVRNNGTLNQGYGVLIVRSDQNFNSQVILVDGDTQLVNLPSSFQYGPELHVSVTFNLDGSVTGVVSEPAPSTNTFSFSFAPRTIQSTGDNFSIHTDCGIGPVNPRFDDVSIMSDTPPLSVLKSKIKRAFKEVIAGAAVGEILSWTAGALCFGTTGAACTLVLPIAVGIGYLDEALDVAQLIVIFADPPDPEFNTIFAPRNYPAHVVQPQAGLPTEVVTLSNLVFAKLTDLYELAEAWRITLERYQGALRAGDGSAAEAQLTALNRYILSASLVASESAESFRGLRVALNSLLGIVPITQNDIEAGRAELAATGLPEIAREIFSNLGFSSEQMDNLLNQILSKNITNIPKNVSDLLERRANILSVLSDVASCLTPECLAAIPVVFDIKPNTFPNSINPKSKGVIPVAIITTDTFDATAIDPLSVKFGPNGAMEAHSSTEDVNGDGRLDLVLQFNTQDTGIKCGNTSASLVGKTFDGQAIEGIGSIQTVGCK